MYHVVTGDATSTCFLRRFVLVLVLVLAPRPRPSSAETFEIDIPGGGSISVSVSHVDPGGELVAPAAPTAPPFNPPTIFSAPLPSGSGARALGQGGAFTAIADDATAASWNPAGLTQLERPEASIVGRAGREINEHRLDSESFAVGEDEFDSEGLNYFSFVIPFRFLNRNVVFSANYQEAYDFTQRFTADTSASPVSFATESSTATFTGVQVDSFDDGIVDVDVTTRLTTLRTSMLEQMLTSQALAGLEYEQEGVLDALTYSFAAEITPKLSAGVSVNFYQDGHFDGRPVRSRTRATYGGTTESSVTVNDTWVTSGTYSYDGIVTLPPGGTIPIPIEVPVSGEGVVDPFSGQSESTADTGLEFEGVFEQISEFERLTGVNFTLGMLLTVSRYLTLGATVDLPWEAEGSQTRTVRNEITTYDETRMRMLDYSVTEEIENRSAAFEFPLYWAAGAAVHWTPLFFTSLDVSQTLWSDFSFQAYGEPKVNPLDGTPHGENPLDDCWSVRLGAECLVLLSWTEIPLRGGIAWEQRPAIGEPDEYWTASCGTGISLGKGKSRVILDIAYLYTVGEDVIGSLVPEQPGLATDVERHQVFASGIWHF